MKTVPLAWKSEIEGGITMKFGVEVALHFYFSKINKYKRHVAEICRWLQHRFCNEFSKITSSNLTWRHSCTTARKVSKYGVFSGPYFPAFWLNTERYFVSLRIQSECGKLRTRKNSVFGHVSYSVLFREYLIPSW